MAKSLHNRLIYHIMDKAIDSAAREHFSGRMVDIGCGVKPYEGMLRDYVTEHVGVDREQPFNVAARIDMVGTAYEIPVGDGEFDCALSTAALEHLAEPELALRECFRVLGPGGKAIYTVPLIWHIHSAPWDYYRFTRYGLEHLFEKVGFKVLKIEALSGFWVTIGQLSVYYVYRFQRGPLRKLPVIPALGVAIQLCAFVLDKIDRAEDWTWMYLVVAEKPVNAPAPE